MFHNTDHSSQATKSGQIPVKWKINRKKENITCRRTDTHTYTHIQRDRQGGGGKEKREREIPFRLKKELKLLMQRNECN